jgi:hypothetical protein
MMARRIDPEPISIYMAIMATFAASVAAVNYVKTHHRPLPSKVRSELVSLLAELEDHTKHLRMDLSIIEDIFRDATFQRGPAIALGNGAQLTENEFSRYEDVSDHVFSALRKVHKLSLKIERKATSLDGLEMAQTTNALGETYTKLDQLLQSRELILQRGWKELRSIARGLEQVIDELRSQLGAR